MYTVFHIDGGIGKNIVATNVIRNIKKTYPDRKLIVVCPWPDVFVHNPNIYRLYKTGSTPYFYDDFIKGKDTIIFKHEPYNSDEVINKKTNLAQAWCNCLNLELDKVQPEIFLNNLEIINSDIIFNNVFEGKPVIAIQTHGGFGHKENSVGLNWYRDLPLPYVQTLINQFSNNFTFVQIRNHYQPQLKNTKQVDLNVRELLILLSRCTGAVGIDSFVQHAMASLNKPSVVTWIGNSPKVYGYEMHKNIISNLELTGSTESYLQDYSLQANGYQCPSNYNIATLFEPEKIISAFNDLYLAQPSQKTQETVY